MLTKNELLEQIRSWGVTGDVMVHSSYKAIGGVAGGARTVVDALCEVYETVLFPTFNFNAWTENHYWDKHETPSEMGIITEVARKLFARTHHPIYSFAIKGYDPYENSDLSPRAFGASTVFERFLERDGVIITIGIGWNQGFSLVHHAEQMAGADYRRHKEFSGIYKTHAPHLKTYSMFVRKDGVITDISPCMEQLHSEGIVQERRLGDAVVYMVEAKDLYDRVVEYAVNNPKMLHKSSQQESTEWVAINDRG